MGHRTPPKYKGWSMLFNSNQGYWVAHKRLIIRKIVGLTRVRLEAKIDEFEETGHIKSEEV